LQAVQVIGPADHIGTVQQATIEDTASYSLFGTLAKDSRKPPVSEPQTAAGATRIAHAGI
jgi:hypothetical protein